MKQFILITSFVVFSLFSKSQSGTWVWLSGDSTSGSMGNYGTKGVPSFTNSPPAKYQAAYWIDLSGNFWMFGGVSSLFSNDLWRYNPNTNEWTWMRGDNTGFIGMGNIGIKGVQSPLVDPPVVGWGANCWTDTAGDLWLFGGTEPSTGIASDNLFRYNIASNQWTWMNGSGVTSSSVVYGPKGVYGSTFIPGGRSECKSGWRVGNELWLFGGYGNSQDALADMWSYDINTNLWAFRSGSTLPGDPGSFGTLGVSNSSNRPPARWSYTKWQNSNDLFLFSGGSTQNILGTNDTWKYNLTTQEWTWISGSNQNDNLGSVGNYCEPNINKYPRSRIENQTAQTLSKCSNAFWSFGGFNLSLSEFHNDLWLFNASNMEWTKVSGYTSTGNIVPSSFGAKGVPSPANMPLGRGGHCTWSDLNSNLYIFGGLSNGAGGALVNDLWKFIPDTTCFKTGLIGATDLFPPANTSLCPGDTIKMNVPANVNIQVTPNNGFIYDTTQNSISFYESNITYTVMANSTILDDPCFKGDTVSFEITVIPDPIADFNLSPNQTTLSNPVFTLVNTSINSISYEWYDDNNQFLSADKDLVQIESKSGQYCYTLKVKNSCGVESTQRRCGSIFEAGFVNIPNAFSPNGDGKNDIIRPIVRGDLKDNSYQFAIYNRWGQTLFKTNDISLGWDGMFNGTACDPGVYYYYIKAFDMVNKKIEEKGDITLLR